MITSRYITQITAVLLSLSIVFCGFSIFYSDGVSIKITEYQKKLFGEETLLIDIKTDESDWQNLINNASLKEWIPGDITINGEQFSAVGLRTKGNSSLTQISNSDSDRYSLQFKFNYYVKGQTCYGLDTFCVNNLMGDATYMKDYIAYEIFDFLDVATPLKNYAKITVNGEDYGFFLALERYEKSFLDRMYNTSAGNLYNVKIQMGGREDFENLWQDREDSENPINREIPEGDFPFGNENFENGETPDWGGGRGGNRPDGDFPFGNENFENGEIPDWGGGRGGNRPDGDFQFGNQNESPENSENSPSGEVPFENGEIPEGSLPDRGGAGGFGGGMMGGGSGGGSLLYTDDNIDSYLSIFNNAIFSKTSDEDKKRVITAIENLNNSTNLETYFDVDAILKYFAAHTTVVNLDSYISNMQQNYYIYECDGKITILPWDYGLSFGGFQSGNASSVVNFPIDTPVSGVSMEDRPLLNNLLQIDEYRDKYHEYLQQIVEGYFESGLFENTVNQLDSKINEYVKNDSTALFTYEQYTQAIPNFITLGLLRSESIKGQLNGAIPSTDEGQKADSSALIDASSINISSLGSTGGGQMGGNGRNRGEIIGGQTDRNQIGENSINVKS